MGNLHCNSRIQSRILSVNIHDSKCFPIYGNSLYKQFQESILDQSLYFLLFLQSFETNVFFQRKELSGCGQWKIVLFLTFKGSLNARSFIKSYYRVTTITIKNNNNNSNNDTITSLMLFLANSIEEILLLKKMFLLPRNIWITPYKFYWRENLGIIN